MSTLSASLLHKDVRLELKSSDHHDVLEELLLPLRSDTRVHDWELLRAAILSNSPDDISREVPSQMLLHHSRTESVSELVLSAGRSIAGIDVPGAKSKVHLIILAAIPEALNNEYLRILGAISRVCRDASTLKELLDSKAPDEFLTLLEEGCRA